jgi:soluble lytic murein transglycosylase-like protein
MQIVQRWHPNVDPLNVSDAIDYAGQYLAKLKKSTGSWQMALAAYNWGIGNLKNKGFENAPKETRDYVIEVAGDVLGGFA